ncbi:hypothetical protein [Marinospirillum perlucidum]|uniref:hypothetical protein n=1 Tax=Marinospirillum perlucidum TaxID=1982602 RepID=UPI00139060CE|nr:hypothetical protein [Marinospirillum perlucidum]
MQIIIQTHKAVYLYSINPSFDFSKNSSRDTQRKASNRQKTGIAGSLAHKSPNRWVDLNLQNIMTVYLYSFNKLAGNQAKDKTAGICLLALDGFDRKE